MTSRPLSLNDDRIACATYYARHFARSAEIVQAIIAHDAPENPELTRLCNYHRREMRRHLEGLAQECGYELIKLPQMDSPLRDCQSASLPQEEAA